MDESPDPLIGFVVGDRYRIDRRLAEGGMARLYAGVNVGLGAEVAIKVMHEIHGGRQDVAERAEREARVMGGITSPYVARVFDLVRLPDGRPCLITELLHGEDLSARIARTGRLAPVEAARIARDVARGLVEAHARGVLHRDIKPSNVFLTTDGQVKLLDFGVAKIDGTSTLTHGGTFIGTPAYMSPEQAQEASSVDERSDIYSLGALLYHILSGQPPYGKLETAETLMRRLKGDPPRLTSVVSSVPAGLVAVVERAMSRDREDRHASAAALAESLEPYATSAPTEASDREARWVRTRLLGTVALATVCSGAVAAAVVQQLVRWSRIAAEPGDWRAWAIKLFPVAVGLVTGAVLLRSLGTRWRSAPRVQALLVGLRTMIWTTAAAYGFFQLARAAGGLAGMRSGIGEPLEIVAGLGGALLVGVLSAAKHARAQRRDH